MVSVETLKAAQIVDAIRQSGVEFIVAVPDATTSEHLLPALVAEPSFRMIRVCKEDEGVSICTGLSYCDGKALLFIQYTGLLDSINALRGIAVEHGMPVCVMVGLLGKEPGVKPTESSRYGLRIVEPILDVMGIEHHLIEEPSDVSKIAPAIEKAYHSSRPVVMLIGRRPE
jgi:sulfopyruvate decarboxylase TPP-binding subunit